MNYADEINTLTIGEAQFTALAKACRTAIDRLNNQVAPQLTELQAVANEKDSLAIQLNTVTQEKATLQQEHDDLIAISSTQADKIDELTKAEALPTDTTNPVEQVEIPIP